MKGWKTREWKSRHQSAGVEIAGVESWHQKAGVENALETSMESQNSRSLTLLNHTKPVKSWLHVIQAVLKVSWLSVIRWTAGLWELTVLRCCSSDIRQDLVSSSWTPLEDRSQQRTTSTDSRWRRASQTEKLRTRRSKNIIHRARRLTQHRYRTLHVTIYSALCFILFSFVNVEV